MKIYLARHGQTTGDVEDRYGGDYDDHLTDLGKAQAEVLAGKLKNEGLEIIFSSPKIRARETSERLASVLGIEVKLVEGFRERNHGVLTGMVKAEARQKYPQMIERHKDPRNTIEGGESYESFGERVKKALAHVSGSAYSVVGVISHGGPIRFIFREILSLGEIQIGDGALAVLESTGGGFSVDSLDGISFVPDH